VPAETANRTAAWDLSHGFDVALGAFDRAVAGSGQQIERRYSLAGHEVRFLFAGSAMVPRFTPALGHLPAGEGAKLTLTVRVWDGRSTGTTAPPIPPVTVRENTSPRFVYRGGDVRGIAQPVEEAFSMLDLSTGEAVHWVVDAETVPYYETAAPIRHILSWWGGVHDRPLVHAAAVGRPEGGVLLVGRGGSGKSTTALASLHSDLLYLGDDYVLVEMDAIPTAHTLYSSGKIQPDNIHRLPRLEPAIANPDRLDQEKAILYVAEHFPDKLCPRLPIRAVVVPRLAGRVTPRIHPCSPALALAAMAPSTLLQLPGTGQESLDAMTDLLSSMPAFVLELAGDVHANVEAIADLLTELGSG
jgi:hypothetical protein